MDSGGTRSLSEGKKEQGKNVPSPSQAVFIPLLVLFMLSC